MDGIQGYAGPPRSPHLHNASIHHPQASASHGHGPAGKSAANYLRALRRRIWFVMAIGVPLTLLFGIVIAYQPNVYSAVAMIAIVAPENDPVLTALVSNDNLGHESHDATERYGPNRIAMLRSRTLAETVVNDPQLTNGAGASEDAPDELIASLQTRPVQGTNHYTVTLEGNDAARVAKSLSLLLEAFRDEASREISAKVVVAKSYANDYLTSLQNARTATSKEVFDLLKTSDTIGPGGTNLKENQYNTLSQIIINDHYSLRDLSQQSYLSEAAPRHHEPAASRYDVKIAELEVLEDKFTDSLEQIKSQVRDFDHDPAARTNAKRLENVRSQLKKYHELVESSRTQPGGNPYDALIESKKEEIRQKEKTRDQLLAEVKASMQTHQKFIDALDKLKLKDTQIADMEKKIWEFNAVSQVKKEPVQIISPPIEPTRPIRPKRLMNMIFAVIVSFGLGIGLVCLLEHIDHSVKEPEHLTAGLSLPLFGVIPRIRRSAALHRGGHLWTPGMPDSIEADAFRNLRASLLGVTDKKGPIVTLLVTSAKAGEGKSTTALNLAATCARAGERTLLMDVDLRRPSLAGVFQDVDDEAAASNLGLVDVLRGDLPWQRTVVRTDIANLDFMPTGDTTGIPIEILGALELRQLLIGLSSHYDRVILDGPAILGLADCRMLGRIVDASLLVVRSGSQELRPLQHAKAMLEQSHVVIAGVVFNGLHEDLKNWSSYGPETPYGYTTSLPGRTTPTATGLEAPAEEPQSALPMASSR